MSQTATTMNTARTGHYRKDEGDEAFLERMNDHLRELESASWPDGPLEHPLVMVCGVPRSATTLTSQVLAHGLDIGYVDNLAARFWRAPVHGLRLSQVVLGRERSSGFASDYARTDELGDIHEFGYFWREWLRKSTLEEIVASPGLEDAIDWAGLRRVLGGMQQVLGRGIAAKNINGSYHMRRFSQELGATIWVHIQRDPVDAAISIHDARQRYYGDPSRWWSYTPLEYPQLAEEPWDMQVAGQVFFLQRMYDTAARELDNVVQVPYAELCGDPHGMLERVAARYGELYGGALGVTADAVPTSFPMRTYEDDPSRLELRQRLAGCLERWQERTA